MALLAVSASAQSVNSTDKQCKATADCATGATRQACESGKASEKKDCCADKAKAAAAKDCCKDGAQAAKKDCGKCDKKDGKKGECAEGKMAKKDCCADKAKAATEKDCCKDGAKGAKKDCAKAGKKDCDKCEKDGAKAGLHHGSGKCAKKNASAPAAKS